MSCAVALAVLLFHLLEHVVVTWWHGEHALHAFDEMHGTMPLTLVNTAMVAVAFLPYFMIKQIEEKTGQHDLPLISIGLKR